MRSAPANWNALFGVAHKTEYKLTINGVDYYSDDMQGNPIITRPLLDKPAIGRVCSATMTVTIRPVAGVDIPKAAAVSAYVRLVSKDGLTTTAWVSIGKFNISSRSGKTNIALTLRDDMIKAGQTYLDKTSISNWPVQQSAVVDDIAAIMGVTVDSRTVLKTGSSYRANIPDSDMLISEVLSYIAVCNGGNWIITEEGKLRLIPLASPAVSAVQALGTAHNGYTEAGIDVVISRVTLTDAADQTYTAGNDTGYEVVGFSPYADQTVANNLLLDLSEAIYRPYRIETARINPLIELGDTVSAKKKDGTTVFVALDSATISCNVEYTAVLEAKAEQDGEEEFPYQTAQELQAARSIRSDRTYYGTSLNRASGLVIRKMQGDTERAKVTFNADEMAFYQGNTQVLFFDAVNGKWKISADMEVMVKNADGSTTGLNVLAQGLTASVSDVNGRTLALELTVDGLTITDPQTGQTLINGGSIYTDNLFLNRLFSRNGTNSYIEMLDNGLNFILNQAETIGIGYYSSNVPLPYMIFGAGSNPQSAAVGMIKKYSNGIWIGDAADRYTSAITTGTGIFVDTNTRKIYKYVNGIGVEFADTSNVIAVFG